jgi:hypothetical protein
MLTRNPLFLGAILLAAHVGAKPAVQQQVIEQTAMETQTPTSLAEQAQAADAIVRATVTSSEVRAVPGVSSASDQNIHSPLLNLPDVYTYYDLDLLENLKRSVEHPAPIQVAQKVGQMTWGQYLIKASPGDRPLMVGDTYVLFLRWSNVLRGFTVGPSGAFQVKDGRVVPLGSSRVAQEHSNRPLDEFVRTILDGLARR